MVSLGTRTQLTRYENENSREIKNMGDVQSKSGADLRVSETETDALQCIRAKASEALAHGLSVLPIRADGSKKTTLVSWKQCQKKLPSAGDIDAWFSGEVGLGIVTGKVSKNLECLDFDDSEIYERYCKRAVEWGIQGLLEKVRAWYHERSPDGHHLLYYCDIAERSQKLARRPIDPGEASAPRSDSKVLIETRGEGAYFIAAPSCGGVHKSGKPYELVSGGFGSIQNISADQREDLLSLARSFDEVHDQVQPTKKGKRKASRPGDDFAAETSWSAILEPSGWTLSHSSHGVDYWTRLGKSNGVSASTNYMDHDLLHVFSTSTDFNADRSYGKFAAYAILNHQGDFGAAAKQLAEEGFGSQDDNSRKATNTAGKILALADSATLFHSQDDVSFASVVVEKHQNKHVETWPIESSGFRSWLQHQYYIDNKSAVDSSALKEAIATLSAKARFEGKEIPVYRRVARWEEEVYLDLCNDAWEIIRVTPRGWSGVNVEQAPIRLYRTPAMEALPTPEQGSLDPLRELLNLPKDDGDAWILILVWMTSVLAGISPYAVLALTGEQGSAKSTTAKILRQFVDPNQAPLRSAPRNEEDLMIAAKQSGLVTLDNVSNIPRWLSDALCRVSTGGGCAKRGLYTNDEEHVLRVCAPVLMTSIGNVVSRSDLIDRSVIIDLPRIMESDRRTEKELEELIGKSRSGILGGLLDVVAAGLRNRHLVRSTGVPRMADFADWGIAIERGVGWENGRFLDAYTRNRKDSSDLPLESTIAQAIIQLAKEGKCKKSSCKEILRELVSRKPEDRMRDPDWPKSARSLSQKITELAPNFRDAGFQVDRGKTGSKRWVTITPPQNQTQTTVPMVPNVPVTGESGIVIEACPGSAEDSDRDDCDSEWDCSDNICPRSTPGVCSEMKDGDDRDDVAGELDESSGVAA